MEADFRVPRSDSPPPPLFANLPRRTPGGLTLPVCMRTRARWTKWNTPWNRSLQHKFQIASKCSATGRHAQTLTAQRHDVYIAFGRQAAGLRLNETQLRSVKQITG